MREKRDLLRRKHDTKTETFLTRQLSPALGGRPGLCEVTVVIPAWKGWLVEGSGGG